MLSGRESIFFSLNIEFTPENFTLENLLCVILQRLRPPRSLTRVYVPVRDLPVPFFPCFRLVLKRMSQVLQPVIKLNTVDFIRTLS